MDHQILTVDLSRREQEVVGELFGGGGLQFCTLFLRINIYILSCSTFGFSRI